MEEQTSIGPEVGLRVALFITCYNDTLFPETGKAVVNVLERLGHAVEFPAGQTCCGQMHWNTGYQAEALPLVGRFVEQFRHADPIADMAFLVMDLIFQGQRPLARAFADTYIKASADEEGRALLPFYTAYRAAVRAKVEGIENEESEVPAALREARVVQLLEERRDRRRDIVKTRRRLSL